MKEIRWGGSSLWVVICVVGENCIIDVLVPICVLVIFVNF